MVKWNLFKFFTPKSTLKQPLPDDESYGKDLLPYLINTPFFMIHTTIKKKKSMLYAKLQCRYKYKWNILNKWNQFQRIDIEDIVRVSLIE